MNSLIGCLNNQYIKHASHLPVILTQDKPKTLGIKFTLSQFSSLTISMGDFGLGRSQPNHLFTVLHDLDFAMMFTITSTHSLAKVSREVKFELKRTTMELMETLVEGEAATAVFAGLRV